MENKTTYFLIRNSIIGKQDENSPYRCGNTDIMEQLEEISYERAMELTGGAE